MKRILIVNNNMHIGGVQKSLLNLLNALQTEYEITLLLFYRGGALLSEVPEKVTVLTGNGAFCYWGMTKNDTRGTGDRIKRGFWAALHRLFGRKRAFRLAALTQKKLQGYDAAISFLHSGPEKSFYGGCNEFVLHCADAERKYTFLHCDYGKIHAASAYNAAVYRSFDGIAACSEGCRSAFLAELPELSGRVKVVSNFQDFGRIRELAEEDPVSLSKAKINILSVCRFGKEKGVLRALEAVRELGAAAKTIHYYLIGDGAEYPKAKSLIEEWNLKETVFLLGEMENPYGYMKAADLLLIPSVSEAAPMVIGEAACLGTPILSTETSSAREMVEETGYGWVCENSVKGITEGLRMLTEDPDLLKKRRNFLEDLTLDNTRAKRGFLELIT